MKPKNILMLVVIFMTIIGVNGCSNDGEIDYQESLSFLKITSEEMIEKESLPDWLVEKINKMETEQIPLSQYKIYQGIWKSQTIYYIYDYFASCMYCSVYTYDGHNINWVTEGYDFKDFAKNSKEWKCIYVINYNIKES